MSRILVIQPHKMLQHAFSIALFPEHQVEVAETMPDAAALKDVDLVIVDAAALRERDAMAAGELRDVQSWKTPTIWIDNASDSEALTREKLVVVNRPSSKESLHKAVAECLGTAGARNQAAHPKSSSAAAALASTVEAREQEAATAPTTTEANFIELVDVVEEGAARDKSRTPQKKTK